jgi:DNA-binding NtrC family response regulator
MSDIRILIVEDEINIAKTMEATLNHTGYRVEISNDGKAALARLQNEAWQIVLLDIKLPGMDGMEVLRQIHEQKIPVQVVMVTAYGSVDFAVQAMKYGAVDFIEKPFEPNALRAVVQSIEERQNLSEQEANEYRKCIDLTKNLIQAREYPKAIASAKQALELRPESVEAYNLLGAVYEIMEDFLPAVQAYKMALKFNPDFRPALASIKNITETGKVPVEKGNSPFFLIGK